MATQMRGLLEANRSMSESLRSMTDSRIRDLQESNDRKSVEIRTPIAEGLKAGGASITATLAQVDCRRWCCRLFAIEGSRTFKYRLGHGRLQRARQGVARGLPAGTRQARGCMTPRW